MLDLQAYLIALAAMAAAAFLTWLLSLLRRDVSIVDSLWSLMFLIGLGAYMLATDGLGPRATLMYLLVAAWSLRLSVYITVRNHGQPEDRRYQAIRANNEPHFWLKSLYIVFGLQAFLAWVICLPAIAAVSGQTPPGPLDYAGVALWVVGMFFEVVGDYQLSRFRRERSSRDEVLDTGLWRYTRHPNYFGEAVLWWGIYLIALSAGAWWTVFAPLLMTFLLLKVSGVALLEKDIADRRPAYRDYIQRTRAFFPGPPRAAAQPPAAPQTGPQTGEPDR
jgi:steroid 5-alpha reductase family enzyme